MELSTDVTTGGSLLSSASDAATPIPNHRAQAGYCRDITMRTSPTYCPAGRRPSTSAGNGVPENSPMKNPITPRRKSRSNSSYGEHNALVVKLQSELAAARSELERKDILATSLQHQLDQRRHTEEQTQARSEQDLTVALAEASALKKELERTSQLLMDGAVARQQLEQRCSVLKQELEQSDARAKELEEEVFEARVQITKVWNELQSRRNTSLQDAEITFAQEVRRVEAKAKHEIDALRERAGTLREALERETSLYEEACSERDTAVREASEAAEKAANLREEVKAEAQADAKSAAETYLKERMALLMEQTKKTIRQQAETLQAEMKEDSDAVLRETIRPLLEKLRNSDNRAKALEAENGRLLGAIDELHDSTMAVVLQAGINIEFPR